MASGRCFGNEWFNMRNKGSQYTEFMPSTSRGHGSLVSQALHGHGASGILRC